MIGNEAGNLTSYLNDEVSRSLRVIWDTDLTALLWYWESSALGCGHHQKSWKVKYLGIQLAQICGYKEVRPLEVRTHIASNWPFQVHGLQGRSMQLGGSRDLTVADPALPAGRVLSLGHIE